jgi:transposase
MIVAERQREKRAAARSKRSIARLLRALEKEFASLDQDIREAVRGSPIWRAKEELLSSVPGIGPTISRAMIAELPELGMLPELHRRRPRHGADCSLSGCHGRIRCNPRLRAFHQRLINAGKPKMVALIAVARKLLTILNAILRDNRPWQPA